MLKGSDIIGMPIIAHDTGELIEEVKDLIFDHSSKLLGFLVKESDWFGSAQLLPLHGLKIIGADVIVASSRSAVIKANQVPRIREVLARNLVFQGTKIITESGRDLGTIIDLYFDQTGAIEGYEVLGGCFADPDSGRSFVPAPQTLKIGDDVAFVPHEIAALMEEWDSSTHSALPVRHGSLSDSTFRTALALTSVEGVSLHEMGVLAEGPLALTALDGHRSENSESETVLSEALLQSKNAVQQQLDRSQPIASIGAIEQSLGRRVRRAVRTQEGLYVAAPGQIVTEAVIIRAQRYHQEPALMAAVDRVPPSQHPLTPANLSKDLETILATKRSRNPWQRIDVAIRNGWERSAQAIETWRIKQVVGRPVDRVILDRQDQVILHRGDLITYQVIEQARQANLLDVLLSSASRSTRQQIKEDEG